MNIEDWLPKLKDICRTMTFRENYYFYEPGDLLSWAWEGLVKAKRTRAVSMAKSERNHVYDCVRWAIIDGMRRENGRYGKKIYCKDRNPEDLSKDTQPSPLDEALLKERADHIKAAVQQLTPKQQRFVDHCFYKGGTLASFAESEGTTRPGIHDRKKRTIRKLRKLLDREQLGLIYSDDPSR